MIKYIRNGDIFNSEADVIVNPVNTKAVMGKGLALAFKQKYPRCFKIYKNACEQRKLKIGSLLLCKTDKVRVLHFPTKEHWKNKSKLSYIEVGLKHFVAFYEIKNIKSIGFPKLGCGLGGLNWENEVKPLMEKYLSDLNIPVEIYI